MSLPVTAAYVFDRETLLLRDADAPNLTQLNYAFALIQDGCVTGSHWTRIDHFKDYAARHTHILPVLSIGGWRADGFSQAAASPEERERFVSSTLALMQQHGFLGVDIDWEYPTSRAAGIAASLEDRKNFTLLLAALRRGLDALSALDGKPRLLAAALGAAASLTEAIDCKAVGRLLDQVNLMTYDMQTARTMSHMTALYGYNAYPDSADHAVRAYTKAGIPKEKIMLGCACYARLFTSASGCAVPFGPAADDGATALRYDELMAQNAWVHAFDAHACAAYASDGARFATYDSPRSIACKGDYVTKRGLMGLMCWEYGGNADGALLSAMHQSTK